MIKEAIGILDIGLESFTVLETLANHYKHERFIYVTDLNFQNENEKVSNLKSNVERLLKENLKLLICVNDKIFDYIGDFLNTLQIPVINIIPTIIDYVNANYEQKNICLLAKNEIIDANIYQKNFKYNHLYNIAADEIENLIINHQLKTTKSFLTTQEIFKSLYSKDIDVIVTSSPYLITLKTEMLEYLTFIELTDIGEIIVSKIKEDFYYINEKGKGEVFVYSNINKKSFKDKVYWSDIKYKYFDVTKIKIEK